MVQRLIHAKADNGIIEEALWFDDLFRVVAVRTAQSDEILQDLDVLLRRQLRVPVGKLADTEATTRCDLLT